ncbi:MAG: formyl-CoA transferase [Candidatus Tectomicrobia bacterium]|uniref:Formyl-CoA:oxalate CoA-transferase n=1 Tax=Tectimicrobiota bacterium TaxID=2528274 RepID=A0A937VZC9_UNCTE|nr:formyl-CoA transferase [Candidatus Tectomicrobia bacterium]
MVKALKGVRILDMTHVQSGPSCTQMLGFLGADVVKLEPPGRGDITRGQLRDIPNVDSLYFTMLNCNKRSITLNMKAAQGTEIFTELLKTSDVLVENFGPGVLDRLGFSWETIQQINPRVIYASIKGFGSYGPNSGLKAYESIAQAMGGSMSTTGVEEGPPLCTGAQIGDSGSGIHMVAAILAALYQRTHTGRGQRVEVAMQDSVLNLVRVKMRDHQRLQHGSLSEYPTKTFGKAVPRSGNASGGGHPGTALRCKPGGPNDYVYVVFQPQIWDRLLKVMGREELIGDERYSTPAARLERLDEVYALVETWSMQFTKFEVTEQLNAIDVPCGPIMDTSDLISDEHLRVRDMIVDVPHTQRGSFKTVGSPLKLSDSPVDVFSSPLLGEHTAEVLHEVMGYDKEQVEKLRQEGVI